MQKAMRPSSLQSGTCSSQQAAQQVAVEAGLVAGRTSVLPVRQCHAVAVVPDSSESAAGAQVHSSKHTQVLDTAAISNSQA